MPAEEGCRGARAGFNNEVSSPTPRSRILKTLDGLPRSPWCIKGSATREQAYPEARYALFFCTRPEGRAGIEPQTTARPPKTATIELK